MAPLPVVVDTNIIFSALLKESSRFAEILLGGGREFYVCEKVVVEIFRHREKILRLSALTEDDIISLYEILLRRLHIFKEDLISPENRAEAARLCRGVDPQDSAFVALAMEVNGLLWTGDKALKEGLKRKGFSAFYELD